MRQANLPIALAILSAAGACALSASAETAKNGPAETVELARDLLTKKLNEAESKGIVSFKEEMSAPSSNGRATPQDAASIQMTRPTALRDAIGESNDCLTSARLAAAAAEMSGNPIARIDELQNRLASGEQSSAGRQDNLLAEAYLSIGFFEEAFSIASKAPGSRAAAIAAIAAAANPAISMAQIEIPLNKECGGMHELASKLQQVQCGMSPIFGDADYDLIEELPAPIADAILDFIGLALLDRGEIERGGRLERAYRLRDKEVAKSPTRSVMKAAFRGGDLAQSGAIADLMPIASTPGPMRAHALSALIASGAVSLLDEAGMAAILADIEETAAGASEPGVSARLARFLAERRAVSGDLFGAAKALAREMSGGGDGSENRMFLKKLLSENLVSDDPQKRFAALAAAVEYGGAVFELLTDEAANVAAQELSSLGADDELKTLIGARKMPEADGNFLLAAAQLKSGDFEGARWTVGRSGRDPRIAELKERLAIAVGDRALAAQALADAIKAGDNEAIAGIAWRSENWREAGRAYLAANKNNPRDDLILRGALASIASGGSPEVGSDAQDWTSARARTATENMLESPPPIAARVELKRFSSGISQEIEFARNMISK